jgi:nucleoid-associated protein YgaU
MGLRDKYNHAIQTAKGFGMDGSAEERDGKLYFKGKTKTQDEANKIWDAIKTVPDWAQDIVADIQANPAAAAAPSTSGASGAGAARTYTVEKGDTLSQIAQQLLGKASAYTQIFEANRDQLDNPDHIQPGQVLKIPAKQ